MSEEKSYSWRSNDGIRIRVSVEPSYIYSNVCRFAAEPALYPGGALHVPSAESEKMSYSPLARRIFGIGGISDLLIAGDSVTVTAAQPVDWDEAGGAIARAIREQIESGAASVSPDHKRSLPEPDVIRTKVQTLIDQAVSPAVAGHGGSVTLLDVRDNNVYLEFGGGCQGCGMSHVTLKYGVERLIREHVPEVGEILDTTDHAGGKNPYYQPAPGR
jgi:Fe-S cluster biogenesis protein NfuA